MASVHAANASKYHLIICQSRLMPKLIWRGRRPRVARRLREKGKVRGLALLPPDLHNQCGVGEITDKYSLEQNIPETDP